MRHSDQHLIYVCVQSKPSDFNRFIDCSKKSSLAITRVLQFHLLDCFASVQLDQLYCFTELFLTDKLLDFSLNERIHVALGPLALLTLEHFLVLRVNDEASLFRVGWTRLEITRDLVDHSLQLTLRIFHPHLVNVNEALVEQEPLRVVLFD